MIIAKVAYHLQEVNLGEESQNSTLTLDSLS
jgi:hypothetical protein